MRPTVIPLRSFDWVPLRTAFITRPERATYAELAAEFRVPEDRIKRASSDEGWAALRAAHLEEQLKQGDAAVAILRAAKMDSAVMGSFTNLALETVRKLQEIVDQVESKKSVTCQSERDDEVRRNFNASPPESRPHQPVRVEWRLLGVEVQEVPTFRRDRS